jgi:hypothetical protein
VGRDSAYPEQGADAARSAGQNDVRWGSQERHMRIDHIGRACPAEQLTYPLAVVQTQCLYADAGQDPREVGCFRPSRQV